MNGIGYVGGGGVPPEAPSGMRRFYGYIIDATLIIGAVLDLLKQFLQIRKIFQDNSM